MNIQCLAKFRGEMEYMVTSTTRSDRDSLVITETMLPDAGMGCVHTPGHGVEDFDVCKKYDSLEVVVLLTEKA